MRGQNETFRTLFRRSAPLLGAALLLAAVGCSDDSGSPRPRLESDATANVGPFDTVEVRFNVEVDSLTATRVSISPAAKWAMGEGNRGIRVWGDAAWPAAGADSARAGFMPDSVYEIVISHMTSTEGRVSEDDLRHAISVVPMGDSDFDDGHTERNGSWSAADVLFSDGSFATGQPFGEPVLFGGLLAGDALPGRDDSRDWYAFDLTRDQSALRVVLSSAAAKDLSMTFYGPQPADTALPVTAWPADTSKFVKKGPVRELKVSIDGDRHFGGLGNDQTKGTPVRYYLLVTYAKIDAVGNPAVPYTLSVGRLSN